MAKKKTFEEAKAELEALQKTYQRVFATADGQVVLEDLKQRTEKGRNLRPAEGAPLDPYQAVWNEGVRTPIRWITSMIEEKTDE